MLANPETNPLFEGISKYEEKSISEQVHDRVNKLLDEMVKRQQLAKQHADMLRSIADPNNYDLFDVIWARRGGWNVLLSTNVREDLEFLLKGKSSISDWTID